MSGGGWSCPHETNGACAKLKNLPCDPGMKGCELFSRYVFFDAEKNTRLEEKRARRAAEEAREAKEAAERSNPAPTDQ